MIRLSYLRLSILTFLLIATFVLFAPTAVFAGDGAVDTGGTAGNCSTCGGASTNNGYGWYGFSTSGGGPGRFKNGDSWSNVRSRCINTGNDTVIAFVIQYPSGGPGNSTVYVYDSGDFGTYYNYNGYDGGGWLDYGTAHAKFNAIDSDLRAGYSWGSNVAWFCYSDNPVWSASVSSSANKTSVKPGELITWTHKLTQNGPAKSSKAITYSKKVGSVTSDDHTLAKGTAKNTAVSFTSTMTPTQDDVGQSFCRATSAIPSSHTSDNRINSADACVSVPFDWSIEVGASITGVIDSKGKTSSNLTIAEPGGVVTWRHTAKVIGPTKTRSLVTYSRVNREGFPAGSVQLGTFAAGTLPDVSDSQTSTTTVTQDDVDSNLCRLTRATPKSEASNTAIDSPDACVFVPYNYTLKPFITTTSSNAVESGSSISLDVSITNSGPTKSKPTQWAVTQMKVTPGATSVVPNKNGGNSAIDPCGTYFVNATTTCEIVSSGTSVFATSGSVLSGDLLEAVTRTVEDLPIGTQLCYSLSLKARSSSANEWTHAAPVCVTVGKKPKVQVLGGDLAAGIGSEVPANIVTAITTKKVSGSIKTYGSWTEYAVLTNGVVAGMGSGAGYNKGNASSEHCASSLLTFTSAGNSICTQITVKGGYTSTTNLLDVGAAFPVTGSTPTYSSLSDSTSRRIETASSAVTISGGTIEKGNWLVLNAEDQTVTITGNINYTTGKLNSISDIPQLVIIANKINIDQSVTNIDAWLIATGEDGIINTCSNYSATAPLTYEMCDKKLTVNGPVVAKSLYLRRTSGAEVGDAAGNPAEVFNLRPDAYLWSVAIASGANSVQGVYITELPPRF